MNCAPVQSAPPFRWQPVWPVLYFSGVALAAKLAQDQRLPWPPCWFRELTGVPCPTCGGTRCLLAITRLDFGSAFHLNPLFFVGGLALTLWLAGTMFDRLFGCRLVDRASLAAKRWPVGRFVIGMVALNWLYLCFTLPG